MSHVPTSIVYARDKKLVPTIPKRNSGLFSPNSSHFPRLFSREKKKNNSVIASSCSRIRIKLSFHMEPNRPWTYFSLQMSNMVHVSFIYNRENRLYRSVWRFLIVFVKIYRGSNKFRDIHLEKKKKKKKEWKKKITMSGSRKNISPRIDNHDASVSLTQSMLRRKVNVLVWF